MAKHREGHYTHRVGWLRAMVLGANDGIISTAALLLGMAAADASRSTLLTAGMAGLVAGAISMALGEYVSVASQRDTERSDIAKEKWELEHLADHELEELAAIYRTKGLSADLAQQVAVQLTEHDALTAHLRDELGIDQDDLAQPMVAAGSSALAFGVGAAVPLAAAALASISARIGVILGVSVVALVILGFTGARAGGAPPAKPMARVVLGGIAAMGITMLVGKLFGAAVS
ncbi:MAG: VIT family protein [Ilumatobacteraceae bacterium]|nr:VIT family protein [Ilumatobacter sp.]